MFLQLNDVESLIRSLLCEEYGNTVGDLISSSMNLKIMYKILNAIARKKEEKSFNERLMIRREIESLLDQLKADEIVLGVNTYEWVLDALVESEAVRVEHSGKECIILQL